MKTTKNFGYRLMEFQDTMGDQALMFNENFKELDNELVDIESIIEEALGEDAFEEAKSLSERLRLLESDCGGVNLFRGTAKNNDSFLTTSGLWDTATFAGQNVEVIELDSSDVEELNAFGYPTTSLPRCLVFKGENGGIDAELVQNKIPLQNNEDYSISFYVRASKQAKLTEEHPSAHKTGHTGIYNNFTIRVNVSDSNEEAEFEQKVEVTSYNWTKVVIPFTLPEYIDEKETPEPEDDEILQAYNRDISFTSPNNLNNFYISGLTLQKGPFGRDWSLSPSDIMDEDDRLQKEIDQINEEIEDINDNIDEIEGKIGDLSQLDTPHKNNIVASINDIIASKGKTNDIKQYKNNRIATLDANDMLCWEMIPIASQDEIESLFE